uniref:Uncharacterized protein n=1 Tax=Anopheles stephensi TaxID=30069 RepID=A0A182Y0J1_ANOST
MKSPALWMAIGAILLLGGSVNAWGGLFNRFSPEMLANMGYGSHGGSFRPQTFLQVGIQSFFRSNIRPSPSNGRSIPPNNTSSLFFASNEILDEEQQSPRYEPDPCYPRMCSANEFCCPGYICVIMDNDSPISVRGTCMPLYGRKYGELCRHDSDCESGLVCDISALSGASVCRPPTIVAKQYGEDCITSSDCEITRGLCCQVQRRHRQVPRKVCSYFKDPLLCVGTVAADQVKHQIEHTAGEKRIIYNKH